MNHGMERRTFVKALGGAAVSVGLGAYHGGAGAAPLKSGFKKAVITGSTRGIGRAIANLLADEGVSLAICSRNQEEVDSAVAELSAKGVKVTGAVVDVADKASYQAWITDPDGNRIELHGYTDWSWQAPSLTQPEVV